MYSVLIVDDFAYDREIISEVIQSLRDTFGTEVAGLCRNGAEALEFMCLNKPDIAICDVEMPEMNGFELARRIQQQSPGTKIIFCSVYDKFEYAREALYLESCGYVLKPVDKDELLQHIRNVIAKIEEEKNSIARHERLWERLQESKPFLLENLVKRLAYGTAESEKSARENMEYLGIPVRNGFYVLALAEADDFYDSTKEMNIEQRNIFSLKIFTDINEQVRQINGALCICMDEAHFLLLFQFEKEWDSGLSLDSVAQCCQSINERLKSREIGISISVGGSCSSLLDIKFLYEQCLYIMKYKYILGKGKVLRTDDLPSSVAVPAVDYNAIERNVRYLMQSGSEAEVREYMNHLFGQLPENTAANELKNVCYYIAVCMQNVTLANKDLLRDNDLFNPSSILERLIRIETVSDAVKWLTQAILSVNLLLHSDDNKSNKLVVEKVKRFIEEHCQEDLSLNALAEKFFYSPNYLNHIFKKECGETVLEYITKARVEKAKEMLTDQKSKLYDIARKLGYSRVAYFSSLFKRYTGVTPQEFRRRRG